ncbi:hypothetical protein H0G86_000655 [Trichoderma simmonsii]|uniref:Extracellular membrane protein CFEM domain-containing protein n=1 Tax=Trichoderma simmonsii TaxID=1491479 RepID=A0A8G0P9P6_9HYPO|nr:hypothetical protein H0G86_000655 [Trichoderma simmonsii]
MRPVSAAAVLAACLHVGLCDANDLAPRCAVNCASNIRNDKGALDLKTICGNKLMTNSLFQCLISACPQYDYGPAVAHVALACSNLGMSIGPLHPVEVQHVDLEKPQYLPTPSIPPAYGTPGDASQPDTDHLTLSFDISLDLKCNSGPDGLVTVTLPPPAPSTPATSPTPPPPISSPDPGESEGEGDGENQGEGENGNGNGEGENGNATPPAPAKPTKSTDDPATTSSCPPNSTPSSSDGPDSGQAPPQSTDLGEHGDPAVTSAPSAAPGGGNPSSPASTSPCSTASQDTGGLDPQDPNQSSNNSAGEPSHPPNGGDGSQASATSSVATPAPVSPAPTPSSSPCSVTDGTDMSANPIPGPQASKTAEPATVAQPSPLPSPSSPPAATVPASAPLSPPSSAEPADPSSANPPEYTHAGSGEQSPDNSSAFQTSIPESSAEPSAQESPSSVAQAPSYGQGGLSSPAHTPDSQTDDLAAETAESKPTSKTVEPSVTTLWPTAKTNRPSSSTSAGAQVQSSTTTCESGGKETVTTGHDEPMGSVMVKVIRPGEAGAETMFVTVWEPAPAATAASTDMISNVAQLAIGSSVMVESMVDSGHVAEPSSLPTQSGFVISRPTTARVSVSSDNVITETSLPKIALVNGVSKLTPQLCIIALLIILVSGILMS